MEESVTPLSVLGPQCDSQRERIRKLFDSGASAQETLRQLCELADGTIRKVFGELQQVRNGAGQGLCLVALGGYGREVLFPYSDLDLLFLFANGKMEEESRPLIAEFSRTLWDLGFRVSSAGRTIDECKRIEQDNAEFHLALLDRRSLDGDKALFEKLDTKVLSVAIFDYVEASRWREASILAGGMVIFAFAVILTMMLIEKRSAAVRP